MIDSAVPEYAMSSSEDEVHSETERNQNNADSDDAASSRHNSDEEEEEHIHIDYVPSDSDEEIEKERLEKLRLEQEAVAAAAVAQTPKSPPGPAHDSDSDLPSERHNSDVELLSDRDSDDYEKSLKSSPTKAEKPDHKDIFGGDLSDSSDSGDEKEKEKHEEEEEQEEDVDDPSDVMNVCTNRTTADLGKEGPLFVKFPNFLSVETKPFNTDYYEDEVDEEDTLDDEGRTRLKLKVENTIRWRTREAEDGSEIRESNAKVVKWSDGTMSMYLGGEIFEVTTQPMHEHNHLFIRQGAGLQGLSVFKRRVVFRPHSTETLTHRKMTLNMAERSNKSQKVKVLNIVGNNPEEAKRDMIRKEEEKLRAAARRETQQRKLKDRQRAAGLSHSFLEGYESEEGDSLTAIKNRYNKGGRDVPLIGHSSDEESDSGHRLDKAKLDSDEDSSDMDAKDKKASKKKIVSDEESD
ncbi:hypothetical protein L596_018447 [Steinernema carpocapsae]|uniref:RNA polymerase-associated protein LEO1 n=1 Tax=Steinernema carpocapsae TaxID=34508 RepID=A0A4U5N4M2_STECR|nr:hypothetical protein L596_018447 [Steinernema carpocapsae]